MEEECATEVDCPICGQKFEPSVIEHHVNKCLNMNVEKPVTRHQEKKQTTLFSRKRGVKPHGSSGCSKKVKVQKEDNASETPAKQPQDSNPEGEKQLQPEILHQQQQQEEQEQEQEKLRKGQEQEVDNGLENAEGNCTVAPVKIELTDDVDDVDDVNSDTEPVNPFFRKRTAKRKKGGKNSVNSSIDLTDSLGEKECIDNETAANDKNDKDADVTVESSRSSSELFTTCLDATPSPENSDDADISSSIDTTIINNNSKDISLENFRSPSSFTLKAFQSGTLGGKSDSPGSVSLPVLGSSPEFSSYKPPQPDFEKDSLDVDSSLSVSESVTPLKRVIRKNGTVVNGESSAPMTTFQQELLAMSQEALGGDVVAPSPVVLSNFRSRNTKNGKDKQKSFTAAIRAVSEKKLTSLVQDVPEKSTEKSKRKTEDKDAIVLGKIPLAEQMRPKTLDDYVGQVATNTQTLLRELFHHDRIPSMILWGPPGCGKTSLAHIICQQCKSGSRYRYVSLSATMSGVNDVKEVVKIAKNEKGLRGKHTVLFIDEVHRFNKMQQDSFLPHIEDGTIVLIGATTENPSFHLNNALTSRCRVVVLHQLSTDTIVNILNNAVTKLHGVEGEDAATTPTDTRFVLEKGVTQLLADYSNGDARIALTSLDMILQAKLPATTTTEETNNASPPVVTCQQIKEELKRSHVKYDRAGDEHYDIISAFHKSIRGGDKDATLYWLARMLEGGEEPLYVARRMVRIASEDIGIADSSALTRAVSAFQACQLIGMPECDVVLAHVATYLCEAPKSVAVYSAYNKAKALVKEHSGGQPGVPLHLRNAPTKLMKQLDYGKGYKYTPNFSGDDAKQDYLPKEIIGTTFFK